MIDILDLTTPTQAGATIASATLPGKVATGGVAVIGKYIYIAASREDRGCSCTYGTPSTLTTWSSAQQVCPSDFSFPGLILPQYIVIDTSTTPVTVTQLASTYQVPSGSTLYPSRPQGLTPTRNPIAIFAGGVYPADSCTDYTTSNYQTHRGLNYITCGNNVPTPVSLTPLTLRSGPRCWRRLRRRHELHQHLQMRDRQRAHWRHWLRLSASIIFIFPPSLTL